MRPPKHGSTSISPPPSRGLPPPPSPLLLSVIIASVTSRPCVVADKSSAAIERGANGCVAGGGDIGAGRWFWGMWSPKQIETAAAVHELPVRRAEIRRIEMIKYQATLLGLNNHLRLGNAGKYKHGSSRAWRSSRRAAASNAERGLQQCRAWVAAGGLV